MKKLLVITLFTISIYSCATFTLEPIPSELITIKKERGSLLPQYENDKIKIIIYPKYYGDEILIEVSILNISNETITFNDTDFCIENSSDGMIWTPLKVYTSKEFYSKEKVEYIAGAVVMILGAVADTANAGYGTSSSNGYIYGSSEYGSYSGSYTIRTSYYDPVAAELAAQRNAQTLSSYESSGKEWLLMLEKNLFYSIDLLPGNGYNGLIFAKKKNSIYYQITCTNSSLNELKIKYIRVKN